MRRAARTPEHRSAPVQRSSVTCRAMSRCVGPVGRVVRSARNGGHVCCTRRSYRDPAPRKPKPARAVNTLPSVRSPSACTPRSSREVATRRRRCARGAVAWCSAARGAASGVGPHRARRCISSRHRRLRQPWSRTEVGGAYPRRPHDGLMGMQDGLFGFRVRRSNLTSGPGASARRQSTPRALRSCRPRAAPIPGAGR